MGTKPELNLRPALETDAGQILQFIRELADYENLLHEVTADEAAIAATLFGQNPSAHVVMADHDGTPVGFALYHGMYSTFMAKPGLYLEDLYVQPAHRGLGIGTALLTHLAQIAIDTGQGRLDWSCLDWNEPSLAFYRGIGARELKEWVRLRVDGTALEALASGVRPEPEPC